MMNRLLIAQCGDKKLPHRARAMDLYQGSLWQSIRIHAPGRAKVAVLSAEHGLIPAEQEIEPYDRLMSLSRSEELEGAALLPALFAGIGDVFLVGGRNYVGLGAVLVKRAVEQRLLPPSYRLTVVCDQHGYMRQAMNKWLHEADTNECDECQCTATVKDRRDIYDPSPYPRLLCDACAEEAQAQAEWRATDG